jgi:predicted Zn finger-like uncharacterized protein
MTVHCSHCSTGYLLPDHLLGPRGARVRCPKCGKTFVVLREPAAVASGAPAGAEAAAESVGDARAADPGATGDSPAGAAPDDAGAIAREVLQAVAERLGGRLAPARAAGRVLAEFGPDLMAAYDEYRRRLGAAAPALPFKHELRSGWGVDLITGLD